MVLKGQAQMQREVVVTFVFKLVNWIINDHTLPDCQNDLLLNITNHKRGILGVPKHEEIIEHTNHMHGKMMIKYRTFRSFRSKPRQIHSNARTFSFLKGFQDSQRFQFSAPATDSARKLLKLNSSTATHHQFHPCFED